jgi:hypothetical protein
LGFQDPMSSRHAVSILKGGPVDHQVREQGPQTHNPAGIGG